MKQKIKSTEKTGKKTIKNAGGCKTCSRGYIEKRHLDQANTVKILLKEYEVK